MLAALVAVQNRDAIETHVARAVALGISRDDVHHAVLTGLGIASVLSHAVTVLEWVDAWFVAHEGNSGAKTAEERQ